MVFYFTNMDGLIPVLRPYSQDAQEKTNEYEVLFKFYILKLINLILDGPLWILHMPGPRNRKGHPNTKILVGNLVSAAKSS